MEKEIFENGLALSFETYYKTHHTTQVLGWEKDVFLLTRAVFADGKAAELQSNDICKIRFLKEGIAYGFESQVLAVQFYPFPLMFIKYPADVACVKIRVAPRFKTNLPIQLYTCLGALITGAIMLDISEGGCGLKVPAREGDKPEPETDYTITCKIMDKELKIGCTIKKIEKVKDVYMLGMLFSKLTTQNKEMLSQFLDFLKKNAEGQ